MTTYDVTVTRDGKWWMIAVPSIDGLTQARRLSEVDLAARELIAVTEDVPLSTVAIRVVSERAGVVDISSRVRELSAERAELAAKERSVRYRQTELAQALAAEAIPLRDIGSALGVSFQRAQQLVS